MLSGYGYDNTDPEATGCADDAYTAKSTLIRRASDSAIVETIELRYSPSCRTTWGRIQVINYNTTNYGYVYLYRLENGTYYWKTDSYASPGDSNYTNQFYDGGVKSYAYGALKERDGHLYYTQTAPY